MNTLQSWAFDDKTGWEIIDVYKRQILGMTVIAENSLQNTEKVKDCLSKISLSGAHLLELINEVLDMSKIESGKMSLSEEVIHLDRLVGEVAQIIRPEAENRKQKYEAQIRGLEHGTVCGCLLYTSRKLFFKGRWRGKRVYPQPSRTPMQREDTSIILQQEC